MRTSSCICVILLLIFGVSSVSSLTNDEFYGLVKDYITEETVLDSTEESDDEDDDVIELPGGPDDNVDIERLVEKLGASFDGEDKTSNLDYTEDGSLSRARCRCRRHYCECCISKTFKVRIHRYKLKFRLRACLKAGFKRRGFEITFTLNGYRVLHRRYSLRRGISLCYRVPQFPAAKICLTLYNINIRRRSMCARLSGVVNLRYKRFKVHLRLGCFRIREYKENSMTSLEGDSDDVIIDADKPLTYTDSQSQQELSLFNKNVVDLYLDSQDDLDLQHAPTDDVDLKDDLDLSDDSFDGSDNCNDKQKQN